MRAINAIEMIQRRQRARRGDLEHRTGITRSAAERCPVEIAVDALNQTGVWIGAISAIEMMQRRQDTCRGDLEYRTSIARSAVERRPVKIAVAALNKRRRRMRAVSATEVMQRRQRAGRGDLEHRARVARSAAQRCPVKITIDTVNQSCLQSCRQRPQNPLRMTGQAEFLCSAGLTGQSQQDNRSQNAEIFQYDVPPQFVSLSTDSTQKVNSSTRQRSPFPNPPRVRNSVDLRVRPDSLCRPMGE